MRKLTVLLLSVMVIMALFVSCTVEVNEDTGETVTLRFTTDEAEGMRSLSASKQTFDATLYKWYYTAEKCDKDADKPSPASGSKSSETLVGTEGSLSDSVGPFSLGKWNFTIKGYTKEDSPQLAWEGSAKNEEINTSTSSVSITVEPVKTADGTGTIFIGKDITLTANNKTYTANYSKVTSVLSDCYSDTTDVEIDKDKGRTVNDSTLLSGVYKVEVSYKASEGVDTYTYATNFIYVNVWNGLTTTIGGTLDESKKYMTFEATDSSGSDAKVSVVNTTTGASYTDLQTAIDKASSGNTIKVTENVVVSDTITASKDITLVVEEGKTVKKYDVDGNTITLFTEGKYKFVSSTAPSDVAVGDTLVMGSIPSSDTTYGGMNVTWNVLAVNSETATVISEKVLLTKEHNDPNVEVNAYNWATSFINKYLNNSEDGGFVKQYGLSGIQMATQEETLGNVFLFSESELVQYGFDGIARIAYGLDGSTASAWWLRDTGDKSGAKYAMYVKANGVSDEAIGTTSLGVRPGFFINIASSN